MAVFGSSGRHANPLGIVSVVAGLAGALASAVLWIYRIEPGSRLLSPG
ncbi:MAG: hypothetical protein ACR2L4_06110 [Actinomycetota bacterium]